MAEQAWEQLWVVKDRDRDYTVRKGLNGIVVARFTNRRAAMAYIDRQYLKQIRNQSNSQ